MADPTAWVERLWYQSHPLHHLLRPLSWLFGVISATRRSAYRLGLLRTHHFGVPVIVVGNLSVGGVGKTPVVIDLVQRLQADGWRPGVVSRGYGAKISSPLPVSAQSDPAQVGDEPVMIARKTGAPVVVAPDRTAAARLLLAQGINIIVADDGLQHYALVRDVEIVVTDGSRRFGNGQLLPAGPLREQPWRLQGVDLHLISNGMAGAGEFALESQLGPAKNLLDGEQRTLDAFDEVHAVAGIGQPEKFFAALEAQGLRLSRHVFADHYVYHPRDLQFTGNGPILMTEKDAVKCSTFRNPRLWSVLYQSRLPAEAWHRLRSKLPAPPAPSATAKY